VHFLPSFPLLEFKQMLNFEMITLRSSPSIITIANLPACQNRLNFGAGGLAPLHPQLRARPARAAAPRSAQSRRWPKLLISQLLGKVIDGSHRIGKPQLQVTQLAPTALRDIGP
jgi:hypothetical protein